MSRIIDIIADSINSRGCTSQYYINAISIDVNIFDNQGIDYQWSLRLLPDMGGTTLATGHAYNITDLLGQIGLALINIIPPSQRMQYLPQGDNGEEIYKP